MATAGPSTSTAVDDGEAITVVVRMRKLTPWEKENKQVSAWDKVSNSVVFRPRVASSMSSPGKVSTPSTPRLPTSYTFDEVYGHASSTEDVYKGTAQAIVMSTMSGFNGTIFAYGITSSGKTYTMLGAPDRWGIIPHSLNDIFQNIQESSEREFMLRVSYMEIYNEKINDLLGDGQGLDVHEDPDRGVFVSDLTEKIVHVGHGMQQVLELIAQGEVKRHFGATNLNEKSSRSHTVFRMVIESSERITEGGNGDLGTVRVSSLNLVDLAGSERVSFSGAEGDRFVETCHINKSLLTLGNVVEKLCERAKKGSMQSLHVPYRDSKLTRILQNALGGNARTGIICTISPAAMHSSETHNTLLFASRAKQIHNRVKINEVVDEKAMLKKYRTAIIALKKQLMSVKDGTHLSEKDRVIEDLQLEKQRIEQEKGAAVRKLSEEQQKQRELELKIKEMSQMILVSTMAAKEKESILPQTQQELQQTMKHNRELKAVLELEKKRSVDLIESSSVMETELQTTKRKLKQAVLDLKQVTSEKAELAELAQRLKDSHDDDQVRLNQLQSSLESAQHKAKLAHQEHESTTALVTSLQRQVATLQQTQSQVTELQQTVTTLQTELQQERASHITDCQSLNQDMQVLHATVQQQKQQLQSQHQSSKQLQISTESDKQAIADLMQQLKMEEENGRKAQAAFSQRLTEITTSLDAMEASLTKEKQNAKQHLTAKNKLQDECEVLKKSLEQEAVAKKHLQEMLEQQSNFDSDQTQYYREQCESLKEELQSCQETLTTTTTALDSTRSELSSAQQLLRQRTEDSQQKQAAIERLTDQLKGSEQMSVSYESRYKQEITLLQEELEAEKQSRLSYKQTISALEADIEQLNGMLAQERAARMSLEKARMTIEVDLQQTKQQADEEASAREKLGRLLEMTELAVNEVSDLKEQLQEKRNQLSAAKENLSGSQKQVVSLQEQLSKLKESNDLLEKDVEKEKNEKILLRGEISQIGDHITKMESQLKAVHKKYSDAEKQRTTLQGDKELVERERDELKTSLAELRTHLETLESSSQTVNVQVVEMEKQLRSTVADVKDKTEELQQAQRAVSEANARIEQYISSIAKLNQECDTLRKQINDAQLQQTESSSECSRLSAELSESRKEVRTLELQLDKEKMSRNTASGELQRIQSDHAALTLKHTTLMTEATSVQRSLQTTHMELNETMTAKDKLESELSDLKSKHVEITTQLTLLQEKFSAAVEDKQEHTTQLEHVQGRLNDYMQRCDDLHAQILAASERESELSHSSDTLREQLSTAEETNRDLTSKLQAAKTAKTEITTQQQTLMATVGELQAQITTLSEQLGATQDALAIEKEKVKASASSQSILNSDISRLQQTVAQFENRNITLAMQVAELEKSSSVSEARVKDFSARLAESQKRAIDLDTQVAALASSNNQLSEAVAARSVDVVELTTQLETERVLMQQRTQQVETLKTEVHQLKTSVSQQGSDNAQWQQKFQQAKIQLEAVNSDLSHLQRERDDLAKQLKEEQEERISDLKEMSFASELAKLSAQETITTLQKRLAATTDKHSSLESKVEALTSEKASLQAQLATQLKEAAKEKDDSQQARDVMESTRRQIATLQQQIEEFQRSLAVSQQTTSTYRQQMSDLQSRLADAREQNSSLQETCSRLQKENTAMKEELQSINGSRNQLVEEVMTKEMRLSLFKRDRGALLTSFIDTIDRVEKGIFNIQKVARPGTPGGSEEKENMITPQTLGLPPIPGSAKKAPQTPGK